MKVLIFLPFILQGIVMIFDEFIMHERRSLPRWEQIGHPLDSLTVLVSYLFLVLFPYNELNFKIFVGLALFSCLFITKDEFVHAHECPPLEHWLHAMLFILHPLTFFSAGWLWMNDPGSLFLVIQPVVIGLFMIYQILRWSLPWQKAK